jgi:hypothetical protein
MSNKKIIFYDKTCDACTENLGSIVELTRRAERAEAERDEWREKAHVSERQANLEAGEKAISMAEATAARTSCLALAERIAKVAKERDEARAEVERLKAADSRCVHCAEPMACPRGHGSEAMNVGEPPALDRLSEIERRLAVLENPDAE